MQAAEPIASQQITPCCAERICRLVQWAPFKNNPSLIGRATIAFAGGWIVVGIPIFRSKDGLSVGVPAFPIQRNSMPKVASRSATAKSNTPRLSHSKPPRRVSARAGWCWPHSPRRESAHERPGRPVDPSHCWRIVGDQTVYLAARGASLAQIDDPESVIAHAISELLPACFQDVRCFWQLSSSAGFERGVLKVHLFYWLTEPLIDGVLKRTLRQHAPGITDLSVYQGVQPHYVASPIIEGGPDPIPRRFALEQAGISRDQATTWERLAAVPDEVFEQALAEPNASTAGIITRHEVMDARPAW